MSKITVFFLIVFTVAYPEIIAAQEEPSHKNNFDRFVTVGENFDVQNLLTAEQMANTYDGLRTGDTLKVKFIGKVAAVCKKKGCWMKISLEDGREVMVKFRDYAFFVPRDLDMGIAVINGKAYVEEMSVDDQRHYAEDAGMSPGDISAIIHPKKTFSFIAEGVKIKKEL